MGGEMRYEGGANSRKRIAKGVYDVGAPADAYLHYHHEMSYVTESVLSLGFLAKKALVPKDDEPYRGATFISDQTKVTEYIL
jgi:hypothetical protein